jgi:hypothetical protein
MTDWEHGRFAQHDSTESVHFERGEESSVALRSAPQEP